VATACTKNAQQAVSEAATKHAKSGGEKLTEPST